MNLFHSVCIKMIQNNTLFNKSFKKTEENSLKKKIQNFYYF
jgi:hypothetical protein